MARLHPLAVYGILEELREAAQDVGPLVVAGEPRLAAALARELGRGAEPGAVRQAPPGGAPALVYVLAAPPSEEDRAVLEAARGGRIPVVAVLAGAEIEPDSVPHVLATDVVRAPANGSPFPLAAIARVLAERVDDSGTELAARVPVLRDAVCEQLIARFSRQAGIVGAAVFVPGADLPVLTLNQLRLVLRIGAAHGVEADSQRLPEILAVIGGGLAFRALARQALGVVPVAGWALKGAIAYAGTRALGEAAVRYFRARSPRPTFEAAAS